MVTNIDSSISEAGRGVYYFMDKDSNNTWEYAGN